MGEDRLCPSGTPSGASDAYEIIPGAKTLTPEGFFPNTIQSSAAIADKFWGSDCLFRHPVGTGIGPGAIFAATTASEMSCQ